MWFWRLGSPTICCLQAKDSGIWWYNLVWIWRAENWGANAVNLSLKAGEGEMNCPVQAVRQKMGTNSSFPYFLFYPGPQQIGCIHVFLCFYDTPWSESESSSVVPNSLQPHGLCSPWNSPGQSTGVGGLSLLQGIFPTQGWNPGLLHCSRFFTSWGTSEAIHVEEDDLLSPLIQKLISSGNILRSTPKSNI